MRLPWLIGPLAIVASVLAYACGGDDDVPAGGASSSGDGGTVGTEGGPGGPGVDGGGGGTAPDGAACGTAICTGIAGACGTMVDACGQPVACEACRYQKDATGLDAELVSVASPSAGAFLVALAKSGGVIELATKGAAGWTVEHVAPDLEAGSGGSTTAKQIELRLAPDGTPWIAWLESTSLSVAHRDRVSGVWTREKIGTAYEAALAVASDGTPHLVWAGPVGGGGAGTGIVHAQYGGGNWNTRHLIKAQTLLRRVAIATAGTEPRIAWHEEGSQAVGTIHYAQPDGGGFLVEDVATQVGSSGTTLDVSIAVDAAGKPHVAYLPYRAGPVHAVRDPGWTTELTTPLSAYRGEIALRSSPTGALALAVLDETANQLFAGFHVAQWTAQSVRAGCSGSASMDAAFDSAGTLGIVHTCGGQVQLLVQSGIFPPGTRAACDSVVASLCATACACPHDDSGKCCLSGTNGSSCMSPPSHCPESIGGRLCSSATLDPATVTQCQLALPATCSPDSGVGAVEPAPCSALRLE